MKIKKLLIEISFKNGNLISIKGLSNIVEEYIEHMISKGASSKIKLYEDIED